jgi:hypothetical protein
MANPKIARAGVGAVRPRLGWRVVGPAKQLLQFKAGRIIIIAVREFHLLGRAQEPRDNDPEFDCRSDSLLDS